MKVGADTQTLAGPSDTTSGPRRSTLPSLPRRRTTQEVSHARSSSEYVVAKPKDAPRPRRESRQISAAAEKVKPVAPAKLIKVSHSFLLDGSLTEDSDTVPSDFGDDDDDTNSSRSDSEASISEVEQPLPTPRTPAEDNGWTFDSLVDRLLALPTSKSDSKFGAVFLALYRKFAAPGQLLEAIVVRFEALDRREPSVLTRTSSQLRYLTVIEQWIQSYPGDFAHSKTLRRIRTFISKIDRSAIFAAAAKEMRAGLDNVADDDDTEWGCCDKDRNIDDPSERSIWSYRESALLDDPDFEFSDDLGDLILGPIMSAESKDDSVQTSKTANVSKLSASQQEATKLVPSARFSLTKIEWRVLVNTCLLYTSPSPRDGLLSRMPSSA